MSNNTTVEKIKEYNKKLDIYKEQAKQIELDITVAQRDVERLCAELSEELGQPVTVENAEDLYKAYCADIDNTIALGEEIFKKLKESEGDVEDV